MNKAIIKGNYAPKGYYLWDGWFIKDNGTYHLFHLQLPRKYSKSNLPEHLSGKSKKLRDFHSSIGHATSKDLIIWEQKPTALDIGKQNDWDGLALWTGCTVKHKDKYYMYYTGRGESSFWTQNIGVSFSDDLINWEKYNKNPILEPDPKYYQTNESLNEIGYPPAWRDPFVFNDNGKFFMLISARKKSKENIYNGCIGLAESDDLLKWETKPPILSLGTLDQMENPQIIRHKKYYYLFFSTRKPGFEPEWKNLHNLDSGLYCFYSKEIDGEYLPVNETGMVMGGGEDIYSVQILPNKDNIYTAIGWVQKKLNGERICKLSYPFELKLKENKAILL